MCVLCNDDKTNGCRERYRDYGCTYNTRTYIIMYLRACGIRQNKRNYMCFVFC